MKALIHIGYGKLDENLEIQVIDKSAITDDEVFGTAHGTVAK